MNLRGRLTALLPLVLLACGGDSDFPPDDCELSIIVETVTPEAGRSVTLRVSAFPAGVIEPLWQLSRDALPIDCVDGTCDDVQIAFVVDEPGPVEARVSGSVDGFSCFGDSETINVRAPNANTVSYRVVTTPLVAGAPAEEQIVVVPGGADFFAGETRLGAGVAVSGNVVASGAPIAAHLRLASTGHSVDAFSSAAEGYDATIGPQSAVVDVYPADPSIAPIRFDDVDPTSLGDFDVIAGIGLTGSVLDPAGAPVEDARVIAIGDELPSAVGTSDAAGAFGLQARDGAAATSIAVAPSAASGLPALEGPIEGWSAGSVIAVSYDNGLSRLTRTFTATESDGVTPIAGARVTFVSDDIAGAATVVVDGGATRSVDGRYRRTLIADGAGQITLALTEATYGIVIARPGANTAPTLLTRDVDAAVNTTLAMAATATWTARVQRESGSVLPGAQVFFRPRGELALVGGGAATAIANASGDISIELTGDGVYDAQVDAGAGYGRVYLGQIAAASAGLSSDGGTIAVPDGQLVTGSVKLASGANGDAHIAFFCTSCPTPEIPVVETVTSAGGTWQVVLPDSGTQ